MKQLIQEIHDRPAQLVFVAAGAGTAAISNLLGVAGASRTLLEGLIPYSAAAFDDFLGQTPQKYVHPKTAKLLAGRALVRATQLAAADAPVLGVACTATIVTDRPKRGEHRAHVAVWQPTQVTHYGLHLHKGARNRTEEEMMVSHLILNAIATALSIPLQLPLPQKESDRLTMDTQSFTPSVTELMAGKRPFLAIHAHGLLASRNVSPQVLLPGAFNPLHTGHIQLAQTATRLLNQPIAFELSAENVDKPPLAPPTLLSRVAQFAGRWPIYVSRAPTFLEKARLFPNCTFVVGIDTAVRILQPRYYSDSVAAMQSALDEMQQRGCRFLIGGRLDQQGRFRQADSLDVPEKYREMFQSIPETAFRVDLSSTELRERANSASS